MAYINGKKILFGAPMTVVPGSGSSESYDKGYKDGQLALLEDSEYMKGTVRGTDLLSINDVSPVEHDLSVFIKPIAHKKDQTILSLTYESTDSAFNFKQSGSRIDFSGTPTSEYTYIPLNVPTLEVGRTYFFGLIYYKGTPEQYPFDCGFMINNPSTGNYEPKLEMVWGQEDYSATLLRPTRTDVDYSGCQVLPVISTEYVGIGCECTESVENISVSRYGKNLMPNTLNKQYGNYSDGTGASISAKNTMYIALALFECLPNTTYVFSSNLTLYTAWEYSGNNLASSIKKTYNKVDAPVKITTSAETHYLGITLKNPSEDLNALEWCQLELGTTATEYEPYVEPQTVQADESGTVRGLTSLHPNTVLIADTQGVNINCMYYRDIDTYINNLSANIALTGGE